MVMKDSIHELAENTPRRLILISHGYRSSSRHPAIVAIRKSLEERRHTTLAFDFSHGDKLDIARQVDEITQVIWHCSLFDEIYLMAGSFGALSASIATSRLARVKGLITVNGFFGFGELGRRHRNQWKAFKVFSRISPRHRRVWQFYQEEFRPSAITTPVLVIHADSDDVVFPVESQRFFDLVGGRKELKTLTGANHHLSAEKNIDDVVSIVDTWLSRL